MPPEDDQLEIEFPEYEPTDAELYDIEDNEDRFWFENYMGEFEDYEPYDWSDVILEDSE